MDLGRLFGSLWLDAAVRELWDEVTELLSFIREEGPRLPSCELYLNSPRNLVSRPDGLTFQ